MPEHLKRARTLELKALNQAKRRIFAEANFGHREPALVENTPHRESGRLTVLTCNYLSALLPASVRGLPPGTLLPVVIRAGHNPEAQLEAEPAGNLLS